MPKVLPEYLQIRREQILDAAASCFARRGFHQTTMQAICEESELSPGAVYRYFRSKEEIIEAMCASRADENIGIVSAEMEREGTLAVFDGLADAFFGALADDAANPAELCALRVEVISEAPRSERIREMLSLRARELRQLFVNIVQAAQGRGEISVALNAEAVATAMIALYEGFVTQKLVEPSLDTASYTDVVKALFHGTFWRFVTPTAGETPTGVLRH